LNPESMTNKRISLSSAHTGHFSEDATQSTNSLHGKSFSLRGYAGKVTAVRGFTRELNQWVHWKICRWIHWKGDGDCGKSGEDIGATLIPNPFLCHIRSYLLDGFDCKNFFLRLSSAATKFSSLTLISLEMQFYSILGLICLTASPSHICMARFGSWDRFSFLQGAPALVFHHSSALTRSYSARTTCPLTVCFEKFIGRSRFASSYPSQSPLWARPAAI
jgi:hypothetical protein